MTERACSSCSRRLDLAEFSPGQGRCKRCRRDLMREQRAAEHEAAWAAESERRREALKLRVAANKRMHEAGKRRQAELFESLGFTLGPDGFYVPPPRVQR